MGAEGCADQMRQATFLVVLVAIVGSNSVEVADGDAQNLAELDGLVTPLHESTQGQLGDGGREQVHAGKIKTMVVPASPKPAKAPEPTVKSLTPKHFEMEKKKWLANPENKGKTPTEADEKEFKRLALTAAAREINGRENRETAQKKADKLEKEKAKKIVRYKKNIKRIDGNAEYLKNMKKRGDKRNLVAAEDKVAIAKKKEAAEDSVAKAEQILDSSKGDIEKAEDQAYEKEHFLKNIDEHEEEAQTEKKEADVRVKFELEDAKKVKVLLKKMEAKKVAVSKFTKALDKSSKLDYAAAKSGIAKAKGDYAKGKSGLDKITKEVAKHEAKLEKTKKLIKLAVEGVTIGFKKNRNADVIKSAENDSFLQHRKAEYQKDVDKENIKASGKQKLMAAANKELQKAEKLQTLARKQKERVRSDKETVAAQLKKIEFFKKEVKKAEANAVLHRKRGKAALKRVHTMRIDAIDAKEKAEAKVRYLKRINIPLTKRALGHAKTQVEEASLIEKQAQDRVDAINKKLAQETKRNAKNQTKKKITKENSEKKDKKTKTKMKAMDAVKDKVKGNDFKDKKEYEKMKKTVKKATP